MTVTGHFQSKSEAHRCPSIGPVLLHVLTFKFVLNKRARAAPLAFSTLQPTFATIFIATIRHNTVFDDMARTARCLSAACQSSPQRASVSRLVGRGLGEVWHSTAQQCRAARLQWDPGAAGRTCSRDPGDRLRGLAKTACAIQPAGDEREHRTRSSSTLPISVLLTPASPSSSSGRLRKSISHCEQAAHRLVLRLWYIAMNCGLWPLSFDRLFVRAVAMS
jgi:hypothetical protein